MDMTPSLAFFPLFIGLYDNSFASVKRGSAGVSGGLVGDAVDLDLAVHHHGRLHAGPGRRRSAEILGVDKTTGSIEAGKIANLVVVKGDVFGKDRYISHVFVDGKYYEQKEQPKREAGGTRNGGNVAPTAGISGTYAVTIDIPGQPMAATLTFVQVGAALNGTMVSQLGSSQIRSGKVSPEGFSFASSVEFGGAAIDITVSGKVTGDQISGSIDSPQGIVPFSGTKNP